MSKLALILMGLMGVFAAPVGVLVSAPVTDGQAMLIIAAPWVDTSEIIRKAGAAQIGPQSAPLGALAYSEESGLENRLREAGAWAVLDGRVISQLCGV